METLTLTRWTRSRRPVEAPVWTLAGLKTARALSLSELAEAAGVDRSTISRILSGQVATPRTRRKLAAALGVEPDLIDWNRPRRRQEAE